MAIVTKKIIVKQHKQKVFTAPIVDGLIFPYASIIDFSNVTFLIDLSEIFIFICCNFHLLNLFCWFITHIQYCLF